MDRYVISRSFLRSVLGALRRRPTSRRSLGVIPGSVAKLQTIMYKIKEYRTRGVKRAVKRSGVSLRLVGTKWGGHQAMSRWAAVVDPYCESAWTENSACSAKRLKRLDRSDKPLSIHSDDNRLQTTKSLWVVKGDALQGYTSISRHGNMQGHAAALQSLAGYQGFHLHDSDRGTASFAPPVIQSAVVF